jgi:EAL domain-containing protein (putative c-di-GMP-specific phosphodiesterase class I)
MGHRLELQVVAEGVETVEQLRNLQQMGCDYVQGFLYSKPVTADEITRMLQSTG